MSVAKFPRRAAGATATEIAEVCVQDLYQMLHAVQENVLVIADDVPDEQREQIGRELWVMRHNNDDAKNALGLPDLPPSVHLQRVEGK